VERAQAKIVTSRGPRVYALTLLQFLFGRGVVWLVCSLLCVAALLGTASRAGNGAFVVGALVAAYLGRTLKVGEKGTRRAIWIGLGLIASFFALVIVDGGHLAARLNDINMVSLRDDARLQLWTAALHMIRDRPFTGFGLGSFVQAYPIYDTHMMPFIMNKAHNDYLELAAGWGLPAAALWWAAMGWLLWRSIRGVYERRRRRVYPLAAIAVSAAVGFHAIFDFSLQMPAIALTFTTILGIGVAQSFPTRGP
ncbi:MAG: O-antigen ligase family protein, partial [Alphaproteobacteria bacterium]|nr:O-antigen ligase family protein [Alphaproteobacteria bacterium]